MNSNSIQCDFEIAKKKKISSDNYFFSFSFINNFKDYVVFIFLATFITSNLSVNNNLLSFPNVSETSKISFLMYYTQKKFKFVYHEILSHYLIARMSEQMYFLYTIDGY